MATCDGPLLMTADTSRTYPRVISRFDQFPFQVQALREGQWRVISCHSTEKAAVKGLRQIRKCRPNDPGSFRIVPKTDVDAYIWADIKNKPGTNA